jgi:hypothetical protein
MNSGYWDNAALPWVMQATSLKQNFKMKAIEDAITQRRLTA